MSRRCVLFLVAAFQLAFVCSAAHASWDIYHPDQFFFTDPDLKTLLNLYDYENEVNKSGGTAGLLEVGDRLRGIGYVNYSNKPGGGPATQRNPVGFELTMLFDVEITATSGSGSNTLFTMSPTTSFETTYGTGAMIAVFHDTTPDFDASLSTVALAEATATDGSLYLVLGATGTWGTDYFWAANGSDGTDPNTYGGSFFSASLALLTNNTGFANSDFLPITQTQPTGFPSSLASITNEFGIQGSTTPEPGDLEAYHILSNDPLGANTIPEPSSAAALIGLAGMGLLLLYRRMKKA